MDGYLFFQFYFSIISIRQVRSDIRVKKIANNIFSILRYKVFTFLLFLFLFILFPKDADAAALYFSPTSGVLQQGESFSVTVSVSSTDQAMNAVSGVISFPEDMLEVGSLSKGGSVISLWVQEPSYSNSLGTVNYEGIVLNPGYTGNAGKLISLTFRAKLSGKATLRFSSGSVLANDGLGTNILQSLGTASFEITSGGTKPSAPSPAEDKRPAEEKKNIPSLPPVPVVTSSTHLDDGKWYANNDPIFSWRLPSGTTGVDFLLDRNANTNPGTKSDGVVNSYRDEDVDDGTLYFHIRFQNAVGWGGVSHFKVQIDTKPPEKFVITQTESFLFDAVDATSGIDFYDVKIDGNEPIQWVDDGSHTFVHPPLLVGRHLLSAKAVDKASNFLLQTAEFETTEGETGGEVMLWITYYPRELETNEILVVRGQTRPFTEVRIWLQNGKSLPWHQTVISDRKGEFDFVSEQKLKIGEYDLWAEAMDAYGRKVASAEREYILVKGAGPADLESWSLPFLIAIIILLGVIILLAMLFWFEAHKLSYLKGLLRKELRGAENNLHKIFTSLLAHIQKHMKVLEKIESKELIHSGARRELNKSKADLQKAERLIERKMKNIDKKLK